jgi:hypothetical protein
MAKKRGAYQRRPLPNISSASSADGVTHALYAKPKNRKLPKKFNTAAPSARPVGGGMDNL